MAERVESNGLVRPYGPQEGEQPIDVRRQLSAIRRSRYLIAFLVLAITGSVLAISLYLPKTYQATATIVREETAGLFDLQDEASVERELATIQGLIMTRGVLEEAGGVVGESKETLEAKVRAAVDSDANIIRVTATDDTAGGAAAIANAVTSAFLEQREQTEQRRIDRARASLLLELDQVRGQQNSEPAIQAIRDRLSALSLSEASIGSELQLAQSAEPPTGATSPRPVRNTILAILGALFLSILVALVRDQLVPRIDGPRALSRITDLPMLAGIPYSRRRFRRKPSVLSPIEHEAYQTLQATIRFQLPSDEQQRIILVTSAVDGEGKTTVTANLGRALARSGHKTLVLSADLRRPRIHELFGIALSPGLSDILMRSPEEEAPAGMLAGGGVGARGNLHVVPSGSRVVDPARLFLGEALTALIAQLKKADYEYVLIDAPPLLGIADSQALARAVDHVLVVARLDRLTLENVVELRDRFDRINVEPVGIVAVGIRGVSYYYSPSRHYEAPVLEEA